jgi:hypothetical protein
MAGLKHEAGVRYFDTTRVARKTCIAVLYVYKHLQAKWQGWRVGALTRRPLERGKNSDKSGTLNLRFLISGCTCLATLSSSSLAWQRKERWQAWRAAQAQDPPRSHHISYIGSTHLMIAAFAQRLDLPNLVPLVHLVRLHHPFPARHSPRAGPKENGRNCLCPAGIQLSDKLARSAGARYLLAATLLSIISV